MKIRNILLEAVTAPDIGGGAGEGAEVINDQTVVSEWTAIMAEKSSVREQFEALLDTVTAQLTKEGGAYYGDTQALKTRMNELVNQLQTGFIDAIDDTDKKLATLIDDYKGYQGSMDSIFAGGSSEGGANTSSVYGG